MELACSSQQAQQQQQQQQSAVALCCSEQQAARRRRCGRGAVPGRIQQPVSHHQVSMCIVMCAALLPFPAAGCLVRRRSSCCIHTAPTPTPGASSASLSLSCRSLAWSRWTSACSRPRRPRSTPPTGCRAASVRSPAWRGAPP